MFKTLAELSGGMAAVPLAVVYLMAVYGIFWVLNWPVRLLLNRHRLRASERWFEMHGRSTELHRMAAALNGHGGLLASAD